MNFFLDVDRTGKAHYCKGKAINMTRRNVIMTPLVIEY